MYQNAFLAINASMHSLYVIYIKIPVQQLEEYRNTSNNADPYHWHKKSVTKTRHCNCFFSKSDNIGVKYLGRAMDFSKQMSLPLTTISIYIKFCIVLCGNGCVTTVFRSDTTSGWITTLNSVNLSAELFGLKSMILLDIYIYIKLINHMYIITVRHTFSQFAKKRCLSAKLRTMTPSHKGRWAVR